MAFQKKFRAGKNLDGKDIAICYFEDVKEAEKFASEHQAKAKRHSVPIGVDGHKCYGSVEYKSQED